MIKYFQKKIFAKIAFLFVSATIALIVSTYFVLNWEWTDKDEMLDRHDMYLTYRLIDSWGELNSADWKEASIKDELKNLKLDCIIYKIGDNVYNCDQDTEVFSYVHNKQFSFSSCDYESHWSTDDDRELSAGRQIHFPKDVLGSFGQIKFNNGLYYEATAIKRGNYKYLLVARGYAPPNELRAFLMPFLLSVVFMLGLYFIIRRFLNPINLMEKRIKSLEGGDLDSSIRVSGKDELALLSKKFNDLIKQIKNLLNQKESLLSEVSHELRTPLAKIKLLMELQNTKENRKKIDLQIEYLDSLITNILIADKMSSPYSELNLSTISVSELIKKSLGIAHIKNVSIEIKEDIKLSIDVIKMSVVIKNLLDNALKYGLTNTPVQLCFAVEEWELKNFMGKCLKISVTDFGPGIKADLIDNITVAFVQGENKQSGFGLGLAICQKVLRAHNGKLLIKNNQDCGCTFTAIVPIIHDKK